MKVDEAISRIKALEPHLRGNYPPSETREQAREVVRLVICQLDRIEKQREALSIYLQIACGYAQDKVVPSLGSLNQWRKQLGWEPLEEGWDE